ncbi:MAG: Maf-like protein [Rhodothalassiaceae bacterium]
MTAPPRILLASASRARRDMLKAAGLDFAVVPADIDEEPIRRAALSPEAAARELALAKALTVSSRHSGALTIGADQILECEGRILNKACTLEEARDTLIALSGRRHRLLSAFALVMDGRLHARHLARASIEMRRLDAAEIEDYISHAAEDCLGSVGCYAIEGRGITLMKRISGGHDVIRGLPMLPLLAALRDAGAKGL